MGAGGATERSQSNRVLLPPLVAKWGLIIPGIHLIAVVFFGLAFELLGIVFGGNAGKALVPLLLGAALLLWAPYYFYRKGKFILSIVFSSVWLFYWLDPELVRKIFSIF